MVAEFGHFLLILAFAVAAVQMIVPLIGARRGWPGWMAVATPAAMAQFALVAGSMAALVHAFVTSDFSLRVVAANSHSAKPLLYKITGTYGNHEGSMLLWVTILALFGGAVALFGSNLPDRLKALVLAVQASIGTAFYAFILFTSNPFERLAMAPFDGRGLNPLLQDPGLAFHPPFLYLGYVGLSVCFSFAVAALIEGRVDAAWARWVRPWTLAAWMFLTVGIGLGSWWAYYELGWGGFWFWDPVENASFMPWLFAAALLHSSIVVEKREALKAWTILLAILAFAFSLIGTFIVRSGVLTSVHAFASDPERGVFILAILAAFVGGALTLFALRAGSMQAKGVFGAESRETALILNNVLLAVSALVVFVGTVWPLIAEIAMGQKVSVGPPFFNMAFTPFFVALALIQPVGALLPWKRGRAGRALWQLRYAGVLALALLALAWAVQNGRSVLGPIGLGLGAWLVAGAGVDLFLRTGRGGLRNRLSRLGRLARADWGRAIAHSGLGVVIFATAGLTAWQVEDIRVAGEGESWPLGALTLRLDEVGPVQGPNYDATRARVTILDGERVVGVVHPEKRVYPVAGMPTTEAGIRNGVLRDIYVVVGDPQDEGGWAMRAYIKPLANWIWGGAILMALGGALSLSDRRMRVGAPARRTPASPGVASGVPAE